jgi:hypothetical protein
MKLTFTKEELESIIVENNDKEILISFRLPQLFRLLFKCHVV